MKKKSYHKPLVSSFGMKPQSLLVGSPGSDQGIDSNQEGLNGGGIDKEGELDPAAKPWDSDSSLWSEDE